MSVKRRFNAFSGLRFDIPHLRSIESSVSADFDDLLKGLITGLSKPYLIRGFDMVIPAAATNASALEISVADSAVLHSTAAESGTILSVPTGIANEVLSPSNPNVLGAFQNGVNNYVSLSYARATDTASVDQVAAWSAGQKAEYQRTASIGRLLNYKFVISTSGYGTNLPLYMVNVTSTGAVNYIEKGVTSLFRLGLGGTVPNPQNNYNFNNLVNPQSNSRREWINQNIGGAGSLAVQAGDSINAFNYGDFAIKSLKEWMDAMMTRVKEITGSNYWYTDSSFLSKSPNMSDLWFDSVGSVITGSGNISYNLILEANAITYGKLQSGFTDPNVLNGDSYIIGVTSGNVANISNFNSSQLIINSSAGGGFIYGETIQNRRLFRPNLNQFELNNLVQGADRDAYLRKLPQALVGSYVTISSWSYTNLANGSDLTINTAAAHGYSVGDFVELKSMQCTAGQPNGVFQVKQVLSSTSFEVSTSIQPSGVAAVIPATSTRLDVANPHPYLPKFSISSWSYVGNAIKLVAPNHTIANGSTIVVYGLTATTNAPNGRFVATVNPDQSIDFTALATPTGTAGGAGFVQPDSVTFNLTVTGAVDDMYNKFNISGFAISPTDLIYTVDVAASPAPATANGPIQLDGVVAITTVADPALVSSIAFQNANIVLTGDTTINVNTVLSLASTSNLAPGMAVSGTGIPANTFIASVLGPNSVQLTNQASATNVGVSLTFSSPELLVTTATNHGYSTIAGPINFTIYGDQADSAFITTFNDVSLLYVSPTQFTIVGQSIQSGPTYTNGGSDKTFARYPNNPYPGPVQWDSDIIVKGIIGDRYFRIPQTSTADGTSLADRFNINGVTGTVYLQDGEVAYIVMERNQPVSNGASFTISAGGMVTASSVPTGIDSNPLRIGDFVKVVDEDESKWCKISNIGFPGLVEGDPLPGPTTIFYLVGNNGQAPSTTQRPARVGRLSYSKGTYSVVTVQPHYLVESSPDIYWLAMRRDNGSSASKVYLKALELDVGESRQIDDNTTNNLLLYTGAMTEGAINPNYRLSDTLGAFQANQNVSIGPNASDIDTRTRQVTFTSSPDLGFQKGDRINKSGSILTIKEVKSSRTVIFNEDVSVLTLSDTVQYQRVNYNINDFDNLTLAIRKEDRELARVNTALSRPIYDESFVIQKINISANTLPPTGSTDPNDADNADQIMAGQYVYLGADPNNPSALAWVLHGTKTLADTIEGLSIGMPGAKYGDTSILVAVITGSFPNTSLLKQFGRPGVTRTVNGAITNPAISGALNVEIVLPPNKRTQITGAGYIVWPSHCSYKATLDSNLTGEDLMVIINDTIRQAGLDYAETFGGPKGKIQIIRDLPASTRIRCRQLPAYGSALAKVAGSVNLQTAYDAGSIVQILSGNPIQLITSDTSNALSVLGSIVIDGRFGGNVIGGILPNVNKSFDIGNESLRVNKIWAATDLVKSHNTHTNSALTRITAADTSTTPAAKIITGSNIAVVSDHAIRVLAHMTARRSDGVLQGAASFTLEGLFYKQGLSAAQAAGQPYSLISGAYDDGLDYGASFGLVGDDIVLVGYGNGVVEWACSLEYQMVSLPT